MNEMIERVARAICIADGVDPDAIGWGLGVQMHDGAGYKLWEARVRQAKAAIAAMREPTGEMKDAGAGTYGIYRAHIGPLPPSVISGQPSKAWQAMIDAALA